MQVKDVDGLVCNVPLELGQEAIVRAYGLVWAPTRGKFQATITLNRVEITTYTRACDLGELSDVLLRKFANHLNGVDAALSCR